MSIVQKFLNQVRLLLRVICTVPICGATFFTSIPANPPEAQAPKPEFPPGFKLPEFFPTDKEVVLTIDLKVVERPSKITIIFLVEETEEGYLYTYKIINDGKYPVAFRYAVLDKISGTEIMMLYLEPDQSRKITLETTKMPIVAEGAVQAW